MDQRDEEIKSLKFQLTTIQEKANLEVRAKVAEAEVTFMKGMMGQRAGPSGHAPSPMPFPGWGAPSPV